jgi:ABC-type multidrug transport system fused ATPase/permease subunit
MFNGSVQFNVLFNSGASQEQMLQAVHQANAYDFIVNDQFELQEEEEDNQQQEGKGFLRTVGAKGSKISGG